MVTLYLATYTLCLKSKLKNMENPGIKNSFNNCKWNFNKNISSSLDFKRLRLIQSQSEPPRETFTAFFSEVIFNKSKLFL